MVMKKLVRGSNCYQPLFYFVSQEKVILTVKQARLELYEISLENSKFCLALLIEQLVNWVQKSEKRKKNVELVPLHCPGQKFLSKFVGGSCPQLPSCQSAPMLPDLQRVDSYFIVHFFLLKRVESFQQF